MSKVIYTMTEDQVLDAIENWISANSSSLDLPSQIHFDLKADTNGFRVDITEKNP